MPETLTKGPRMTDKMTRYQVLEVAAAHPDAVADVKTAAARWEEAR